MFNHNATATTSGEEEEEEEIHSTVHATQTQKSLLIIIQFNDYFSSFRNTFYCICMQFSVDLNMWFVCCCLLLFRHTVSLECGIFSFFIFLFLYRCLFFQLITVLQFLFLFFVVCFYPPVLYKIHIFLFMRTSFSVLFWIFGLWFQWKIVNSQKHIVPQSLYPQIVCLFSPLVSNRNCNEQIPQLEHCLCVSLIFN